MRWTIDPHHSLIGFSVKHLAIATVRGRFRNFTATAETDDRNNLVSVEATIDATTIDTNDERRDAHLRSADFFDVENHPVLTFKSTQIEKSGSGYRIRGDLTMRGVTKPTTIDVNVSDAVKDPWGNTRTGVDFSGRVNRTQWGLNWNQALELGGVLVSEEVRLDGEVQMVAEQVAVAA
jgi:polyisoprenoid-binding protein YceI